MSLLFLPSYAQRFVVPTGAPLARRKAITARNRKKYDMADITARRLSARWTFRVKAPVSSLFHAMATSQASPVSSVRRGATPYLVAAFRVLTIY